MCICFGFILVLALSGVTSVPYTAPGLTQYAHNDENYFTARDANVIHTPMHTHTPYLYFYNILFGFAISVISHFTCLYLVCLRSCVLVICKCVCVGLSRGCSRLEWLPTLCLAFPIFDLSKGCSGHSIIGMLSNFLFLMITQTNKWDEGDRQGFALICAH